MRLAREVRLPCKRSRHRRPAGWATVTARRSAIHATSSRSAAPSGSCEQMEDDLARAKRFVVAVLPREEVAPIGPDDLQCTQVRRRAVTSGCKIVMASTRRMTSNTASMPGSTTSRPTFAGKRSMSRARCARSLSTRRASSGGNPKTMNSCKPPPRESGGMTVRRNPGLCRHRHHVPTPIAHALSDLFGCGSGFAHSGKLAPTEEAGLWTDTRLSGGATRGDPGVPRARGSRRRSSCERD